jgi:hypothetical protein
MNTYIFIDENDIQKLFDDKIYVSKYKIIKDNYDNIEIRIKRYIYFNEWILKDLNFNFKDFFILEINSEYIYDNNEIPIECIFQIYHYNYNKKEDKLCYIEEFEDLVLNSKLFKNQKNNSELINKLKEKNNYIFIKLKDLDNFLKTGVYKLKYGLINYDNFHNELNNFLNYSWSLENNIKYYYLLGIDYNYNIDKIDYIYIKNINKITKIYKNSDNKFIEVEDEIIKYFNEKLKIINLLSILNSIKENK